MRVAIVHDWMLLGGAEKVVEALLQMYPDAPLYTSCISDDWQNKLKDRTVITGYLNKPFFQKIRKFTPFLRQKWFEGLDLSDYDLVISSSGAEAKGIKVAKGVTHINYCHAPTHYYWSRYAEYMHNPGFGVLNPIARLGLKLLVEPMRKWDLKAAKGPDVMIANSTHIAVEIKKYYGRDATVIHPPVDTEAFSKMPNIKEARKGFVIAGRQTPYKRIDLAVVACTQLNLPLTVIGDGPEHAALKSIAGPTVKFTGSLPFKDLVHKFQTAEAFIFPGLDDFGITPVEAMAAGCPVFAYMAGGALDYVVEGKTGIFFNKQTVGSLKEALQKFDTKNFKQEAIIKKAQEFSPDVFKEKITALISDVYQK